MELVKQNDTLAVSIVIPARNEEENVGLLLESLGALNFPREKLEIILVDHESIDRTGDIAREYGARVVRKKGGTISSARNLGVSHARAPIVAFLDADCTVSNDWLERALPYFIDPKVGAVGSYYVVPLEPSTWVRRVLHVQTEARPKASEGKWVPAGNMLVRKKIYWECGGFDESLVTCEDVDLCYRIAQKYRVIEDTMIRCFHHGEPKTLQQVFRKELWRGRDNLLGIFRHGFHLDEMPSIVLPLYTVATFVLLLASSLLAAFTDSSVWLALAAGSLFSLPLIGIAALTGIRAGDIRYIPHLTVLYGAYFLARGLAPFYRWRYV